MLQCADFSEFTDFENGNHYLNSFSSPARSAQSYCCHIGRTRLRLRVRPRHTFGKSF